MIKLMRLGDCLNEVLYIVIYGLFSILYAHSVPTLKKNTQQPMHKHIT